MIDGIKMLRIQDMLFNNSQTILTTEENKGDNANYSLLPIEELVSIKKNNEKIDSIASTKMNSPSIHQIQGAKLNVINEGDYQNENEIEPMKQAPNKIIEVMPEKEEIKEVPKKKYTFTVSPESFIQLPSNCIYLYLMQT